MKELTEGGPLSPQVKSPSTKGTVSTTLWPLSGSSEDNSNHQNHQHETALSPPSNTEEYQHDEDNNSFHSAISVFDRWNALEVQWSVQSQPGSSAAGADHAHPRQEDDYDLDETSFYSMSSVGITAAEATTHPQPHIHVIGLPHQRRGSLRLPRRQQGQSSFCMEDGSAAGDSQQQHHQQRTGDVFDRLYRDAVRKMKYQQARSAHSLTSDPDHSTGDGTIFSSPSNCSSSTLRRARRGGNDSSSNNNDDDSVFERLYRNQKRTRPIMGAVSSGEGSAREDDQSSLLWGTGVGRSTTRDNARQQLPQQQQHRLAYTPSMRANKWPKRSPAKNAASAAFSSSSSVGSSRSSSAMGHRQRQQPQPQPQQAHRQGQQHSVFERLYRNEPRTPPQLNRTPKQSQQKKKPEPSTMTQHSLPDKHYDNDMTNASTSVEASVLSISLLDADEMGTTRLQERNVATPLPNRGIHDDLPDKGPDPNQGEGLDFDHRTAHLPSTTQRHDEYRNDVAATLIQSHWRCYLASLHRHHCLVAVHLIQIAWWRRRMTKPTPPATIGQQPLEQPKQQNKLIDQPQHKQHVKEPIPVVQGLVRRYVARTRFLTFKHVTIQLQAMYRMKMQRAWYQQTIHDVTMPWVNTITTNHQETSGSLVAPLNENGTDDYTFCVTRIQTRWRSFVLQSLYGTLRLCTIYLQSLVRGHLCRRRNLIMRYRHRNECALILQSYVRRALAQEQAFKIKAALITLQRFGRTMLQRARSRKLATLMLPLEGDRVDEQVHPSPSVLEPVEKDSSIPFVLSATTIQSCWRMLPLEGDRVDEQVHPSPSVLEPVEKDSSIQFVLSATTIQSCWRSYTMRCQYTTLRVCTIIAQAVVRGHLCRMKLHSQRLADQFQSSQSLEGASSEILSTPAWHQMLLVAQCVVILKPAYRGLHDPAMDPTSDGGRTAAATGLQRWTRSRLGLRRFHRYRCAAIKIQNLFRGHTERIQYLVQQTAVLTLQKFVRRRVLTQLNQPEYIVEQRQSPIATRLPHSTVENSAMRHHAAVCIQRQLRGAMARDYCAELYPTQSHAPICVPRSWRSSTQQHRNDSEAEDEDRVCAFPIWRVLGASAQPQRSWWNILVSGTEDQALYLEATLTVQSWARASVCQRRFQKFRLCATVVQSVFRSRMARTRYLMMERSVRTLQELFRTFLWKKKMLQRQNSARRIQASWIRCRTQRYSRVLVQIQAVARGHIARRKVSFLRKAHAQHKLERTSAVRIQSWFRRLSYQLRYQDHRTRATMIQSFHRCCIVRAHYRMMRNSLLKLQARCRGHFVRKRVELLSNSAQCIQKHWKASVARSSYKELRSARARQTGYVDATLWQYKAG